MFDLPCLTRGWQEAATLGKADPAGWLQHVEGVSAEEAKRALLVGLNNGFSTVLTTPTATSAATSSAATSSATSAATSSAATSSPSEPPSEVRSELLFERIALFNHSCWPSCALSRCPTSGTAKVYALTDVPSQTELTLCYSDELALLPTAERRDFLDAQFGFLCTCMRCKAKADTHAAGGATFASEADEKLEEYDNGDGPAVRRAHASVYQVTLLPNKRRGGFSPRQHDSWDDAKRVAGGAMLVLNKECEPTHWIAMQVRACLCTALEALSSHPSASDSARMSTLRTLAEHASAMLQVSPPHTDALVQLAERIDRAEKRLTPEAVARTTKVHAKALAKLRKQREVVQAWLDQP